MIIFGRLLRVGVFVFNLLVFLDLLQCPGQVAASVQGFIDGLFFLSESSVMMASLHRVFGSHLTSDEEDDGRRTADTG